MPVARTAVRPKGLSREAVEERSAKEPPWLRKLRLNAWERFSSAELPRLQYGMGIRTDLSGLQLDSLPLETVRDADALRDIRVPDGIELLPLRKAVQRDDVRRHLPAGRRGHLRGGLPRAVCRHPDAGQRDLEHRPAQGARARIRPDGLDGLLPRKQAYPQHDIQRPCWPGRPGLCLGALLRQRQAAL